MYFSAIHLKYRLYRWIRRLHNRFWRPIYARKASFTKTVNLKVDFVFFFQLVMVVTTEETASRIKIGKHQIILNEADFDVTQTTSDL